MKYAYQIIAPFLAFADAIKSHVAIVCLLTILIIIGDAYNFLASPDAYLQVHDLDPSQPYWQWQYLQGNVLITGVCAACFTTIILSYRDWHGKLFQHVSHLFILFVIIRLLVGFYQWYQCGFDHGC